MKYELKCAGCFKRASQLCQSSGLKILSRGSSARMRMSVGLWPFCFGFSFAFEGFRKQTDLGVR